MTDKTIPVYLGEVGTPNRPRIGWASIDPVTGVAHFKVDEDSEYANLFAVPDTLFNTSISNDEISTVPVEGKNEGEK